jgi:hypothetical protein
VNLAFAVFGVEAFFPHAVKLCPFKDVEFFRRWFKSFPKWHGGSTFAWIQDRIVLIVDPPRRRLLAVG